VSTPAVCESCGTPLTMWNRAGWPNKRAICTRCYRGVTPEARKREAAEFAASQPGLTAEKILHYPWTGTLGALVSHTLIFLVCVWIGAYFGGWLLGLVGGFIGMYFVMRMTRGEADIITRRRLELHDGIMISAFWLIFFVNWFWTLFQLMDRDYSGGNPILMLWLTPTIISPFLGLLAAWLTDKGRLKGLAEGFRALD